MAEVVQGTVAPGSEAVREAYERGSADHGGVGASVRVVHAGRAVVQGLPAGSSGHGGLGDAALACTE